MRYYNTDIEEVFAGDTPLRQKARELAFLICDQVKISDERDIAIGKLRACVVWAEAGERQKDE